MPVNFGLLDPNLPAKVANSFYEGQQEQKRNRLAELQMQGMNQQQQLQGYQLDAAKRAQEDEAATRAAFMSSGGDYGKAADSLLQRGQYKPAMELQKNLAEQQKAKVAQALENLKLAKGLAGQIMANPTTENAIAIHKQFAQYSGQDPTQGIAQIQAMNGDPQAIYNWAAGHAVEADKLLPKLESFSLGNVQRRQLTNPLTGQAISQQDIPMGMTPEQQANSPFTIGSDGKPVANIPAQQFQLSKSKAGAQNTNVRIDNKVGEGIAKEVGPMMAASKGAAEGALQQLDVASRIDSAINSGKLYAGPGANARLAVSQVANILGIGGKDNAETLSNTRTAIQSLAQFSLTGRSALKGQGQISDYEGKLLAKATSGDITDLTVPELKVIVGTAKRVSQAQIKNHQRNMQIMRNKPSLSDVADFYDVPAVNESTQTETAKPSLDQIFGK